MGLDHISSKKVLEIFGGAHLKSDLQQYISDNVISSPQKFRSGAIYKKGWNLKEISRIGEKIGFFKKFSGPIAIAVFTTKGGVLKSTLALNIARIAAIHNLKTCVVGLDIQGDVTRALGYEKDLDNCDDLNEVIDKLNQTKGLADLFNEQERLENIILSMDIPNLFLIPETPELVALNDSLSNINRREFWLKEKVIDLLKGHFDLIVMDCSPNWNKLTTNALVACDALLSPLECKINNFRNFRLFRHFLKEFKDDMRLGFENIFIPTRYSANKKLSQEIHDWYQNNVDGCTKFGIRESVLSEEATALNKSLIEYMPNHANAHEMRGLLQEIHQRLEKTTCLLKNELPVKGVNERNSMPGYELRC